MAEKKKRLMQGNEACVEGAIYAGCRFYSGYPITPSTEIAEGMSVRLPKLGGKFIQMEDEIGGIAAAIGGSVAGIKSMTATSGPGFSLKQECIGYACITEIPLVIVDVMRAGPSTGYPTGPSQSDIMQAKWGTHGDHPVIALTPAYVPEILTETVRAFNLAEKYRTPVMVLYDEIVGHMREAVELPEPGELEVVNRARPECKPEEYHPYDDRFLVPPLAPFGEGYRFHITGLNHKQDGFPTNDPKLIDRNNRRIMEKIEVNKADIWKNEEISLDDAEVAVFTIGSTARSARFAVNELRKQGVKAGLLRPLTIWPFPDNAVHDVAKRVKAIIVPEMNLGQMFHEVQRAALGACKVEGLFRVDGEPITPAQIMEAIKKHC
ncbi:MAG: 2-oxoglutarate synthase subunit alpha [Deltaproteobacteria bacterium GWC2_55_46]|nr:MAG: 2-oxoglutarate synthase subunit alpha [Deltaproteobacteria bacterium GWA2_55_82]OGQ63630.1 MAG: 2-oxoglutarate synthase subunit alpha [Deltaproteobacteria bacterium RIFCSPLOWO2_02_FULL_55_12]OIJ74465.1 MAG: 2-oxoglutarate synthase subunit alpha [Deltaproteobacteria bacterium GWC2_55_46]